MRVFSPPPAGSGSYYPDFELPAWFVGGEALHVLLRQTFREAWADIDRDGVRPVEEGFEALVDALIDPEEPARSHRRLVRMGLILALASQAWIHKYTPDDTRADALTRQVQDWLSQGTPLSSPKGEDLYPLVATRHQHLDEDREVHRCLSWMPDAPERCRALLLDILDVTIAGFAVHPGGGLARRDLFHWWLCQAVPAAYMERLPDHIYSGDWPWPPRPAGEQSPSVRNE